MKVVICLAVIALLALALGELPAQQVMINQQQAQAIVQTPVSNTGGPLVITGISITTPSLSVGTAVIVRFNVTNNGLGDFNGKIKAQFFEYNGNAPGGTPDFSDNITESMIAGDQKLLEFNEKWVPKNSGEYSVGVRILYEIGTTEFTYFKGIPVSVQKSASASSPLNRLPQTQVTNTDDNGQSLQKIMVIVVIIFVILTVVGAIAIYAIGHRKKKVVVGTLPAVGPIPETELETLYQKKAEIESMIKIAKIKFYKRKMDEESYKEITKKNEEKLVEIEAKIDEMAGRVKRLEESKK